jgi:hypothetical protein
MAGMSDLMREYERARFPADRRLDVQGEGPRVARERALHWIRSRAHEAPGQELLLIAERGRRPGRGPGPVEAEMRKLLDELRGKLIDWWQPFTPGSLAMRIALDPRMWRPIATSPEPPGDGRTEQTAGSARPSPHTDIPPELLATARQVAELRIEREGLSIRILDVILREVWIEAQAFAMDRRVTFATAFEQVLRDESERRLEE